MKNMITSKPIFKWMGGKSRLLTTLHKYMPANYNNFYEPFIGAGSLFFSLENKNSYIADNNEELIITYRVIRDNLEALIKDLKEHKATEKYYNAIRALDRDAEKYNQLSDLKKASRFLYLRKCSFNGLYRLNKKGQFNISFNKSTTIHFDLEALKVASKKLQSVEIAHDDFFSIAKKVKAGDFVYIDSPYWEQSSNYTKDGFTLKDHYRVKELCKIIDEAGAYFMLSNSYNDDTKKLYKDFNVMAIDSISTVAPRAKDRGKIKELLVTNYEQPTVACNNLIQAAKIAA